MIAPVVWRVGYVSTGDWSTNDIKNGGGDCVGVRRRFVSGHDHARSCGRNGAAGRREEVVCRSESDPD